MAWSLKECADKAEEIVAAHNEPADWDAGFDAGEFSGPAHDRLIEEQIRVIAEDNGFSFDQVYGEVLRRAAEHDGRDEQEVK